MKETYQFIHKNKVVGYLGKNMGLVRNPQYAVDLDKTGFHWGQIKFAIQDLFHLGMIPRDAKVVRVSV